jgi:hypothetical protein
VAGVFWRGSIEDGEDSNAEVRRESKDPNEGSLARHFVVCTMGSRYQRHWKLKR